MIADKRLKVGWLLFSERGDRKIIRKYAKKEQQQIE